MSKFIATYEFEIDCGEINPGVFADLMLTEDKRSFDSIWEYGSPVLKSVSVNEGKA